MRSRATSQCSLQDSTVCSECKTESRRTQAFRELELKIDGLKSIDQALELSNADVSCASECMC